MGIGAIDAIDRCCNSTAEQRNMAGSQLHECKPLNQDTTIFNYDTIIAFPKLVVFTQIFIHLVRNKFERWELRVREREKPQQLPFFFRPLPFERLKQMTVFIFLFYSKPLQHFHLWAAAKSNSAEKNFFFPFFLINSIFLKPAMLFFNSIHPSVWDWF